MPLIAMRIISLLLVYNATALGVPLIKERACAPTCDFMVVTKVGHLRYNLGRPFESLRIKTTGPQTVDIEVVLDVRCSEVIDRVGI